MSLELALSHIQEDKCATWKLIDSSGTYDAVTNPNGWKTATSGGSNVQIDNNSIVQAYLEIIKPDNTTYTFNLMTLATWRTLTIFTNGNPFDSSVTPDTLNYTFPASLLGGSIPDGLYRVTYVIVDTNGTRVESNFIIALYCHVEYCVYMMVNQLEEKYLCERCNDTFAKDVTTAWALYLALVYSAHISMLDRFNNILRTLQQICTSMGCATCS